MSAQYPLAALSLPFAPISYLEATIIFRKFVIEAGVEASGGKVCGSGAEWVSMRLRLFRCRCAEIS